MLKPLNLGMFNALACDDDDADSWKVRQAKDCLNVNKNLSLGVFILLATYEPFLAMLFQDDIPMESNKKGAHSWNIQFRDPPFDDLRIYSTSIEGVIDIRLLNKPFLSIAMFGKPRNWQFMLKWLWEHGDNRQIARSIPQLDPHGMRTLMDGSNSAKGNDQMDTSDLAESQVGYADCSIRTAAKAFALGDIGEGIYRLLLAFQIFDPLLQRDKSSYLRASVGHVKWHISFLVSPFRSLRLQPSQLEGIIDIYGFDKHVKSLPVTDSPQSWQAILEWLWNYGNKRHIAKAEYEASRPRPSSKSKSRTKQQRPQKPLLHQVLRTAGFKAQGGPSIKTKQLEQIEKEADTAVDHVNRMTMQRRALHPASPNGQMRKSRLITSTTADDADENITTKATAS